MLDLAPRLPPQVAQVIDLPLDEGDYAALAVALSTLPHDHLLVLAARVALELRDQRAALREAAHDVHGGDVAFWRDLALNHIPHDELQRRRSTLGALAERRTA